MQFDAVAQTTEETQSPKPVRPASRYFIGGDTLYIEMDKGYLCYKIKNENMLLGIGLWNDKEKLIRQKNKPITCPKTHALTADEKTWLRQSRQIVLNPQLCINNLKQTKVKQTTILGHSNLQVNRIGLGCMGMSEFYGSFNENESIQQSLPPETIGKRY